MNLSEWNDCVFGEVVERVGRPDDPLYFYVDEDVLSAASGMRFAPAEALEDFRRAFNEKDAAARFGGAITHVAVWQKGERGGIPPFLHILTMSVLGVSLPHRGRSSQNVYGRQNELLGLPVDGGCPPSYDAAMPVVWSAWNEWLGGPGRQFGTPTARASTARPYQGWPRSQSFIRSLDKEDVLDFFAELPRTREPDPAQLMTELAAWLRAEPHPNRRLLDRLEDVGYADEFRSFLSSAWRSHIGALAIDRRMTDIPGLVMWDQDEDRFDLVVDSRTSPPLAGEPLQLLDAEPLSVSSSDRFIYLYGNEVSPAEWFDNPLHDWALTPRVVVQREPRDAYVMGFVAGHGWVELTDLQMGAVRLLIRDDVLRSAQASGLTGAPTVSSLAGWSWIIAPDLSDVDLTALRRLVGLREFESERRKIRLVGGLPMAAGQTFLDQGEPDVVFDPAVTVTEVRVDGRDVLDSLEPVTVGEPPQPTVRLRLADLYLGPGAHAIEAQDRDGRLRSMNIRVVEPTRPRGLQHGDGLPRPRSAASTIPGLRAMPDDSLSLSTRQGAVAFIVSVEGGVWRVPDTTHSRWVAEADLHGFVSDPLLELADLTLPSDGGAGPYYVLHTRRGSRGRTWRVHKLAAPATARRALLTHVDASVRTLLTEFIAAGPDDIIDPDHGASTLKKALMARRWEEPRTPRAPRSEHDDAVPVRVDILRGPSEQNPFNVVLDWVSERTSGEVSLRRASEAFAWAWDRAGAPSRGDLRYLIDTMDALGHMESEDAYNRIRVAPTVLSRLPRSASLRVLAGARPTRLVESLQSGDSEADTSDAAEDFLGEMVMEVRAQHYAGTPYAPDAYFLRLEVESFRISDGASDLGVYLTAGVAEALLDTELTMAVRWERAEPIEQVRGTRYWLWTAIRHATEQRGRWKPTVELPHTGSHFVKAAMGRKTTYGWLEGASSAIRELGWEFGRWRYEQHAANDHLVLYRPETAQLLVSASMPLPRAVRRALVSLTGLMPRKLRVHGVSIAQPRRPTHDYWVFENVDPVISGRVRNILGMTERDYLDHPNFDKELDPLR